MDFVCNFCHTPFTRKGSTAKYCSRNCKYEGTKGKELAPRQCKGCLKSFVPKRNRIKFCSLDCYRATENLKPKPHLRNRVTVPCTGCKAPIEITEYQAKRAKYCSKECSDKHRPKRPRTIYRRESNGYISVYADCEVGKTMCRKDGFIQEHRLVMARALDRPLLRSEIVHHINGIKTDNRIENLKLFKSNSAHMSFVHLNECPNCGYSLKS